ncbi:MAG: hypothetical protein WAK55_11420, partial [Xanthobacteraceae bacterium]
DRQAGTANYLWVMPQELIASQLIWNCLSAKEAVPGSAGGSRLKAYAGTGIAAGRPPLLGAALNT